MTSNREIDTEVAEKVMGWQWWTLIHAAYLIPSHIADDRCFSGSSWKKGIVGNAERDIDALRVTSLQPVRAYSTSISAAFEVVEKMREKGWMWKAINACGVFADNVPKEGIQFEFRYIGENDRQLNNDAVAAHASLPMAICLAALKAAKSLEGKE